LRPSKGACRSKESTRALFTNRKPIVSVAVGGIPLRGITIKIRAFVWTRYTHSIIRPLSPRQYQV
jgi:hypothetical protein